MHSDGFTMAKLEARSRRLGDCETGNLGAAWLGAVVDVNAKHRRMAWGTAGHAQDVGHTTQHASRWRLGTKRRRGWQVRENDGVAW